LPVSYDVELTALSVFIAIAMSGVGFLIALDGDRPVAGGTVVGAAIAAMHFIGTAALQLPATKSWDFVYVAASLLIGLGSGAGALVSSQREQNLRNRFSSAILLALGICGMHFTAMAALGFTPDPLIQIPEQAVASDRVAIAVIGVAMVIVAAGLIGSILDQRRAHRAVVEALSVAIAPRLPVSPISSTC
jgi:diguanylate cyclase